MPEFSTGEKIFLGLCGAGVLVAVAKLASAKKKVPPAFVGPPAPPSLPKMDQTTTTTGMYVVEDGDSLTSIAQDQYGDMSLWPVIYDANVNTIGDDPDSIDTGAKLIIPPLSSITPAQKANAQKRHALFVAAWKANPSGPDSYPAAVTAQYVA